jgi:hypothetical protein
MYALVMKFGVNFFAALALATALGVILDCYVRLQERSASRAKT